MPDARRKRILIADDDPGVAELLRELIGVEYEVTMVANGIEALAALKQDPPDLMFLDLHMPGMGGLEVLRRLPAKIPVVVVTATESAAEISEVLAHGAFSYVPKPFNRNYIHHLIAAAIGTPA